MDSANGAPVRRSTLKRVPKAILSVAVAAGAALRDVLASLLHRFLIDLAADPYPAGELYDPSEEYELAREVLAMETLITGSFGSVIGAARVLRVLGSVEPLPRLAHCTAAVRTTPAGDDVYRAFELDSLVLENRDAESGGFSVEVIRTPSEDPWRTVERHEYTDATSSLLAFYSNMPIRTSRG